MEPTSLLTGKGLKSFLKQDQMIFMDIVDRFSGLSVKFNKHLILLHQNIRGLISKTDEIITN
jgi:hypothetical protein